MKNVLKNLKLESAQSLVDARHFQQMAKVRLCEFLRIIAYISQLATTLQTLFLKKYTKS